MRCYVVAHGAVSSISSHFCHHSTYSTLSHFPFRQVEHPVKFREGVLLFVKGGASPGRRQIVLPSAYPIRRFIALWSGSRAHSPAFFGGSFVFSPLSTVGFSITHWYGVFWLSPCGSGHGAMIYDIIYRHETNASMTPKRSSCKKRERYEERICDDRL